MGLKWEQTALAHPRVTPGLTKAQSDREGRL